jgi:hypothetical protein
MKKNKNRDIVIVGLIGLFFAISSSCLGQQNNDKSIDFKISLEKEIYILSEPIWVDISAKNINKEEIRILPLVLSCLECLNISVINSHDDTLHYQGIVHDITSPPTGYTTEPGQTRSNYINLLEGFGEKLDEFGMRRFLKPDKYSIVAVYDGMIKSNEIEFEVAVPEGSEKKAYTLLKEGYDYHIQLKNKEFHEKLEELVSKYPKSSYTDLAYYEMTYWSKDSEDAEKYGKELILKYPNSRFTRLAFWKILRGRNRNQQIQFLKDTIKKLNRGTVAFDWAQGSLKALEGEP